MNMVFFHDAKIKHEGHHYYTAGGLNNVFLKGYLRHFNEITLVTRQEMILKNEDISKLSRIDLNHVKFQGIKDLNVVSIFMGSSRRIIKDNIQEHDYIVIRLPSVIGIQACRFCNKYEKPYLIEMVGCPFDALWHYGGFKAKIIAPIFALITRILVKRADNIMYVSNSFLQKRYPNYKNSIGISDVRIPSVNKEILGQRLNRINNYKANSKYKFGLIGSLKVNYKGQDTAIKSLSLIKDKVDFELHFLGANDEKSINKWRALSKKYNIEDRVFFDGTLPGGGPVFAWLDNLDFYLIPSLTEGLPRSLIEAMSRALVCIGTKAGGIVELLDNNVLIKKKDYKMLSILIISLINDKQQMKRIAKRNFDYSKLYNENNLSKKREQFLKKLLCPH